MNPDLQKQLAEMLAKLTDVAGDATAFAKAQIPPLVQEKIAFGRVWESALLAALLAALVLVLHIAGRAWRENWTGDGFGGVMLYALAAGICIGVIGQAHECLLAWIAPRLYIVEWLTSMVTK